MTTAKSQRHRDRQLMAEVLLRVRRWDPVGLDTIGAPEDEYECLVGPISSALRRGDSVSELAAAVESQVAEHFGVEPAGSLAFAEDLIRWQARLQTPRDIGER
jgi:hypothetical protein